MITVHLYEVFDLDYQGGFVRQAEADKLITAYTKWLCEHDIPYIFNNPYHLQIDNAYAKDVVAFKLKFGL